MRIGGERVNLFELFVKIGADSTEADKGIDDVGKKTSNLGAKIKSGLATAGKIGAAAIGTITAAAGTMYAGLTSAAGAAASYGDNIDKMSQKMGMSAEAYQEWDAVMQHSGTSIEAMQASMKTLANAVETGNEAFTTLGLTQEQLAEMSQEEIFEATIAALQNVEDTTQRTYLAGKLLGRGATELGALLNTSAEDTQAMRDRVHELGGVMSNEAVKAAARYQDSLQDMQTSFSGLKNNLISNFLPGMATVMDGIASLMAGEDGAQATITKGVDEIVKTANNVVPKLLEIGKKLLGAVSEAITSNMSELASGVASIISGVINEFPSMLSMLASVIAGVMQEIPAALAELSGVIPDIVNTILPALVDMLPQFVQTGIDLIVSLTQGIAEALPQLIPAATEAIIEIVDALTNTDNIGALIDAALAIILALAEGLIDALPRLIEAAPKLIGELVTALAANLHKIGEAGMELLMALVDGIAKTMPQLTAAVPKLILEIVQGIGNHLPEIILSGVKITMTLLEGFLKALPDFIANIPNFIKSVVEAFTSYDWKSIGSNIVSGIKNGFARMWESFKESVSNLVSGLVSGVKNILGIASPSKVFAGIGGYMAEGLGQGFDKGMRGVRKDIEGQMDFGTVTVDDPSPGTTPVYPRGCTTNNYYNINANRVREFNDIIRITKNERLTARMGVT